MLGQILGSDILFFRSIYAEEEKKSSLKKIQSALR